VLGNLLFCFGGVRVGQSFVLFWWGSCWAIAQHEPQQNKTKDCPTRTQPKKTKRLPNTNPTKTKQRSGVLVGYSFVLFWWGSCWAIFCFVLVEFVLGNLLFCFGGVRVGQSFVLF
jgi:hypothetical protein